MKPALLVVDLQNEFFADDSPALSSLKGAVENVNYAISQFRRAGLPVVVVRDIEEPHRIPGKDAFAVHPSVAVEATDLHVDKRHGNAFWQTELDAELRARGVDRVVVCGFCAEFCVLNTYRGAVERGYPAAVLRGGIASPTAEHIRMVESISGVISPAALALILPA